MSKNREIAVSTIKLNAQILRDLGLINFGSNSHFQLAELTNLGRNVLSITSQSSLTGKAAVCKIADPGSSPGSETRGERNEK